MTLFLELLPLTAATVTPHLTELPSTLILSAPMHILALFKGEQRLSIYLQICSSAAGQSNEAFFSEGTLTFEDIREELQPVQSKEMQHSRSNNADAAFPFGISQTLHSASSLIERG